MDLKFNFLGRKFLFAMLVSFAGFSSPCMAIDSEKKIEIMPHKALYEIKLSSKRSSTQVSNISGKMFYEWQPSCDAWISSHSFDLLYEYPEAPSMRVTSDFSTHESFDGKSFNFTSQRKQNSMVIEDLKGSANIGSGMAAISEAVYSMPDGLSFDLPEGTLFPIAHTLDVLKKIKSGTKFYNATIFDGSDKDGPVDINTFIGKRIDKKDYAKELLSNPYIDASLLTSRAWDLRLAFFSLDKYEEQADYEMSMIFHENSVISKMEIDYGDFSVIQKLIALEPLGDACLKTDGVIDK